MGGLYAAFEEGLLGLDEVEKFLDGLVSLKVFEGQIELQLVFLPVRQLAEVGEAAYGVGVVVFDAIGGDAEDDNLAWFVDANASGPRAGEIEGDQWVAGDIQEAGRQVEVLHAHEAVEAELVALKLVIMGDQQLLAEPILMRKVPPFPVLVLPEKGRCEVEGSVVVTSKKVSDVPPGAASNR